MKLYPKFYLWLNEHNVNFIQLLSLIEKDNIENLLLNSLYNFDVKQIVQNSEDNDFKLLNLYIDNLIDLVSEDSILVAHQSLKKLEPEIKKSFVYFFKAMFKKRSNRLLLAFYLEDILKDI